MSDPRRTSRGAGTRTLLAFALLLTALLALVAVASRRSVDPGGGRGGGEAATELPNWFSSYLFTFTLVGGFFLLLFGFVLSRREEMTAKGRKRRGAFPAVVMLVSAIALLVLVVRYPEEVSRLIDRIRPGGLDPDRLTDRRRPDATPDFEWIAVAVGSALLVAAAAAVLALPILRRRLRGRGESTLAEALSNALDETLDDVRAEADPRRAIILAYARMESVLERCGVPRRESEAPLEYLSRVLLELDVSEPPVATLTDLFERAKFSHHEIAPPLKEEAIDALETVRAELREESE